MKRQHRLDSSIIKRFSQSKIVSFEFDFILFKPFNLNNPFHKQSINYFFLYRIKYFDVIIALQDLRNKLEMNNSCQVFIRYTKIRNCFLKHLKNWWATPLLVPRTFLATSLSILPWKISLWNSSEITRRLSKIFSRKISESCTQNAISPRDSLESLRIDWKIFWAVKSFLLLFTSHGFKI